MKVKVILSATLLTILSLALLTPFAVQAVALENPLKGSGGTLEGAIKNVTTAAIGLSGVLALIAFIVDHGLGE